MILTQSGLNFVLYFLADHTGFLNYNKAPQRTFNLQRQNLQQLCNYCIDIVYKYIGFVYILNYLKMFGRSSKGMVKYCNNAANRLEVRFRITNIFMHTIGLLVSKGN